MNKHYMHGLFTLLASTQKRPVKYYLAHGKAQETLQRAHAGYLAQQVEFNAIAERFGADEKVTADYYLQGYPGWDGGEFNISFKKQGHAPAGWTRKYENADFFLPAPESEDARFLKYRAAGVRQAVRMLGHLGAEKFDHLNSDDQRSMLDNYGVGHKEIWLSQAAGNRKNDAKIFPEMVVPGVFVFGAQDPARVQTSGSPLYGALPISERVAEMLFMEPKKAYDRAHDIRDGKKISAALSVLNYGLRNRLG